MSSTKASISQINDPANDDFHDCRGRSIGGVVECLTGRLSCQRASHFGNVRLCLHPSAKKFAELKESLPKYKKTSTG